MSSADGLRDAIRQAVAELDAIADDLRTAVDGQ